MPCGESAQRRGGRTAALLVFVVLFLSPSMSDAAETRIALVIGNGGYREAPLKNPPNDARLIADTLKRLGFTLIGAKPGEPLIDADQKAMKRAIRSFGEGLEHAGSSDVGLFFYAGHAVQANGKNYLIPLGADIRGEADLEDEAVSADSVLARMTYAGARVNLVILDACRSNPYRGRFRSLTRGLAEMNAPSGSLVAYSTAPGDVAEDGTGTNSPYSAALAEAMGIAGVPVELAFKRVRGAVMQTTGNRQVPWESSSLIGDFYFAQTAFLPPAQPAPKQQTPPPVNQARIMLQDGSNKMLIRVSCDSTIMRSVRHGQTVTIIERHGDQFLIRDESGSGCIPEENLSFQQ